MKHILTTTAILLATATAINAQSANETLDQALDDQLIPYITSLNNNNVQVDPQAISGIAYETASAWNTLNESEAVAQNAILFNQLTSAQSDVNNLTISLNTAQAKVEAEKQNVLDAQAELNAQVELLVEKQAEFEDLQDEYHDTETAYEFKVANLEDDLEAANNSIADANALLIENTKILAATEADLASTKNIVSTSKHTTISSQ